ncbi:MAG: hypothetical protein ABIL70_08760 [candidate division WOR-3 bacterium]
MKKNLFIFLILLKISIAQNFPSSWSPSYCTYDVAQTLALSCYTMGFGIDNFCLYSKNNDSIAYDERRFDIWARLGIIKNTEFEIKYSYPTAGLISIKYLFLVQSIKTAFKSGFGYMKGTRVGFITDYVYDFYGTLLIEKALSKNIRFTYAPKAIYSLHTRDRQEHSTRPPRHIFQYGHCLSLSLGEKFVFIPEANWLWGDNEGTHYIVNQFGVGVNLKIN